VSSALPTGIVTPLVAFVRGSGEPDLVATEALVDHQIAGGVAGVLANGSMGELGNLTSAQRLEMLRAVASAAGGRVPVWCGIAGLGTQDTVAAAIEAQAAGADALLVLPPLFFDVSDAELERHFGSVAAGVDVPVIAYDVPPRTPRKLPPGLIARLAARGVLQGVKDSSGNLTAGRQLCLLTSESPGFQAYIGTEMAIDAAVSAGFAGSIPGLANILPKVAVDIDSSARAGDFAAAERAQRIYAALLEVLAVPLAGASPVAVAFASFKAATARVLGIEQPMTLPPLTPPDGAFVDAVAAILDSLPAPAGAASGS
jgi:4-hydroxy-tetrahydrodipicolinate synthase